MRIRPSTFIAALTWPRVAIVAGVAVLLGAATLFGGMVLGAPLDKPSFEFFNPSSVIAGPGGLIVVSDSGDRRLVGFGEDGLLRFVIEGGTRAGAFYNGRAIGFDSAGHFYVDDTVLDLETGNANSESILAFDSHGRRLGAVKALAYSEKESADVVHRMIYTQAGGDFIAWFFPAADTSWELHALAPGSTAEKVPVAFGGYDVYATIDAAVAGSGLTWFLESSGRIMKAGPGTTPVTWYDDSAGRIRFPVAIASGPGGEVYVLDGKHAILRFDEGPGGVASKVVLDHDIAVKAGYGRPLALSNLSVAADGRLVAANEATGDVLLLSADGRLQSWSGAKLAGGFALLRLAIYAGRGLTGIALLATILLFYLKVFGGRSRLLVKQLSVLVPLTALAAGAIAWSVYLGMNGSLEAGLRDRLRHVAQLAAMDISAEALDRIDPSKDTLESIVSSKGFRGLSASFDLLVNMNEDDWNSTLFPYAYFKRDGDWFVVGGFDYLELYPYAYSKPEFSQVLDGGKDVFYRYSDVYGSWLSAMTPLRRADGSVAAVVEASMSANFLDELARQTLLRVGLGTLALLVLLAAVFAVFDWLLLRSVKRLHEGADSVSRGDYDVRVEIRSRDEIQDLGEAFNSMSGEIKDSVDRLAAFGRANARFVPREFLSQLGRESITEIGLGDQVLTSMSILFSDIRAFTTLSEGLGPSATMDMLNDYLSRMGPAIRQAGGFIDKYVGDAIMALFPRRPVDAVDAVLAMMTALDGFRAELAERGEPEVDAGFGLHVGPLMLGIIGEEERFEGTVIADAVNLAARLESLTRFYGVHALMSGAVKNAIGGERRPYRFLDIVRVKGKSEPVMLYELVGRGDPAYEAKLASAGEYIRGFDAWRRGDFGAAEDSFASVLESSPGDRPAGILLERSRGMARVALPEGWDGVTEFHEK